MPSFSRVKKIPKETLPPKEEKKPAKLSIDVFETENSFIVQSTVAGIKAEDLDILIEEGILTIRGKREKPEQKEPAVKNIYLECYWGPFFRKIIFPEEVDSSRIEAKVKEGILTIKIPKIPQKEKWKVEVLDNE
jgi:HSP20 family protein